MAARSSSSAAAGLFPATILLLASASALAQAPAPAASSLQCPVDLDKVLVPGSLTSGELGGISSELSGLGRDTATECVCNVAGGSNSVAGFILGLLDLGSLAMGLDCSSDA